jgi:hypothetical protein
VLVRRQPDRGHGRRRDESAHTASTNVLKTDGGYAYDQATWAPWSVPALN